MSARIYKPSASAMQSGPSEDVWVLEFAPSERKKIDPLMGWTGSGDMKRQVSLRFESKEAALAYAQAHGVDAKVFEPPVRKMNVRPMGYAGNFANGRRTPWSH